MSLGTAADSAKEAELSGILKSREEWEEKPLPSEDLPGMVWDETVCFDPER